MESVESVEEANNQELNRKPVAEAFDLEEGTRDATNRIYDMMDEGVLDVKTVVTACLQYMSEDEVADMAQANDFFYDEEDAYESVEDMISSASKKWLDTDDSQIDELGIVDRSSGRQTTLPSSRVGSKAKPRPNSM